MERVLDALTGPDPVRILWVVAGALMLWWLFALVGHRSLRRLARGEGPEAAERLKRVETVWVALRRLAALVIFVLALLTVMAIAGISLTPLLAVGSAVALAVGFGAQNFVKDVIAGFFIIVEGQYRIGDVVRIADIAGKVEEIRLRVTVLRDLDANVHYIPNGEISVASNFTQQFAQVVADVGVAYRSDLDRALEVLGDEALSFSRDEAWSYSFLQEPEVLGVQELADSAVVLRVTLKVLPEARWPVRREFFRRIKNRFDAEGIEIPFPHRTLFLGDPEGWREAIGGRT